MRYMIRDQITHSRQPMVYDTMEHNGFDLLEWWTFGDLRMLSGTVGPQTIDAVMGLARQLMRGEDHNETAAFLAVTVEWLDD